MIKGAFTLLLAIISGVALVMSIAFLFLTNDTGSGFFWLSFAIILIVLDLSFQKA